jgi:hypothetical protein
MRQQWGEASSNLHVAPSDFFGHVLYFDLETDTID